MHVYFSSAWGQQETKTVNKPLLKADAGGLQFGKVHRSNRRTPD
jgi:hypothetical protein